MAVRSGPDTVSVITACSVGRNTLTSFAEGLSVPAIAIRNSGQNAVTPAKPTPVANINAETAIRTRLRLMRCPASPEARVSAADPSSVPVMIAPICNGEKPRSER